VRARIHATGNIVATITRPRPRMTIAIIISMSEKAGRSDEATRRGG
jgi:hypothetical protein